MKDSGERYSPQVGHLPQVAFEPFISYEHWHRYRYAVPFVTGKAVLDIASGEGYGSAFLAEHAGQVCGVDVSSEAVDHARIAYPRENLRFLLGSAAAIPIDGEGVFDVIVSFETVEHLDAPSQDGFAREIKRLLKPDGVLLISTPNRVTYTDGRDGKNEYHLHEFTKEEFLAYLGDHFRHVRMLSQHVYPVSYIWNIAGPTGSIREYQMTLADHAFRASEGDGKEVGYLIAVCDNREDQAEGSDSLLVDLSEVAFRGVPDRDLWQASSLFLDTGQGFRSEECVRENVQFGPAFDLTLAIDDALPVRQLRWDPLESRLCGVCVREVVWEDRKGKIHALAPSLLTSNGMEEGAGSFRFATLDPMIFLPIAGFVRKVTIRGECEVYSESRSLLALGAAMHALEDQFAHLRFEQEMVRARVFERESLLEQERAGSERLRGELQAARETIVLREASATEAARRIIGLEDELRTAAAEIDLRKSREDQTLRQIERLETDCRTALGQIGIQENQLATQENELAATRRHADEVGRLLSDQRRLTAEARRESSLLGENLRDCEKQLAEAQDDRVKLDQLLAQIFNSRRWVYINKLRLALHFVRSRGRRAVSRSVGHRA